MSVQVFLQGEILGAGEFLGASAPGAQPVDQALCSGRAWWAGLLSEVIPRAVLAELGLARILLGVSGGGRFLLVLPSEAVGAAVEILRSAAREISALSGGLVRLQWTYTENLGDWSDVRKRLAAGLALWRSTPASGAERAFFLPFVPPPEEEEYFRSLFDAYRDASAAGWSPDSPGRVLFGEARYGWPLGGHSAGDGLAVARHIALDDSGRRAATLAEMAARADGAACWGILRGRVDDFEIRLRRAATVEEYIQVLVLYRQFFAGELAVACSMGEFFRKVTILHSGCDEFAVCGSWDAIIHLARELQRLFHRFSEEYLREYPGPEGKTLSAALVFRRASDGELGAACRAAGRDLEAVQASGKGSVRLLGRTLEWKQLNEAADLKDQLLRLVRDFDCPPQVLGQLSDFSRGVDSNASRPLRMRPAPVERPWRFQQRLRTLLGTSREREFLRLRNAILTELMRKNAPHQVKLRPSGRVALAWARLLAEGSNNG